MTLSLLKLSQTQLLLKGLDVASSQCSATGCNPTVFWNHLHKGKHLQLSTSEAHGFLSTMITSKDSKGNRFMSREVDVDELRRFLDDVISVQENKSGNQGISLDRFLAFLVSTILWLNHKASGRIRAAFEAQADASKTLNYDSFKKGLSELMSWNEASHVRRSFALQSLSLLPFWTCLCSCLTALVVCFCNHFWVSVKLGRSGFFVVKRYLQLEGFVWKCFLYVSVASRVRVRKLDRPRALRCAESCICEGSF
mmetsp:Transcript_39397/g.93364  ORF Transcript_39397/g.93364 Transcript_39397/m.93364 type:complete len:253 (-) Transcript_39397:484-1242(-)